MSRSSRSNDALGMSIEGQISAFEQAFDLSSGSSSSHAHALMYPIREALNGARSGSIRMSDVRLVSNIIFRLPPGQVAKVVPMLCDFLRVPAAFKPEARLPSSLKPARCLALVALASLASVPQTALDDVQASTSIRDALDRNWPNIYTWANYLYNEVTTMVAASSESESSKSELYVTVFPMLSGVFSRVSWHKTLNKTAVLNDDLLALVVKVWFRSERRFLPSGAFDFKFDSFHHFRMLASFYGSLAVLYEDGSTKQLSEAREMVLREAGDNVEHVTKRLLRYLKHPAKANKVFLQSAEVAVGIIALLAIEDAQQCSPDAVFMDHFLENDLVLLITRLLAFVVEDVARPSERRAIEDCICSDLIASCISLLMCSGRSKNGPHWIAVMLKHAFLRVLAVLVKYPQYVTVGLGPILEGDIPRHFCHRFVLAAAIKSVKEITIDGTVKAIQSSYLKEAWTNFENLLLERTAFNAVYERDFAKRDIRQCFNCGTDKLENKLFKCAGCMTALYCSKECQTVSWKTGDHKLMCKQLQITFHRTGMKPPTEQFCYVLAVFEMHRHMPGILQQVSTENNTNPGSIPLTDAFFLIDFGFLPPAIFVRTAEMVLNTPGQREDTRASTELLLKTVREAAGELIPMHVHSLRGGYTTSFSSHLVPRSMFENLEGAVHYPNDMVKVPNLTRVPAEDENGGSLAYILDEIDTLVLDARENFRTPTSGEESTSTSPKTIYHYVEQKAAAIQYGAGWADFLL